MTNPWPACENKSGKKKVILTSFFADFFRICSNRTQNHRSSPNLPDFSNLRVKTTWIGLKSVFSEQKGCFQTKFLKSPNPCATTRKAQNRDFGETRPRPWRPPERSNLCCRHNPSTFGWRATFSSNEANSAQIRTPRKRDFGTFRDFGQNRPPVTPLGPLLDFNRLMNLFRAPTRLGTALNRQKPSIWGFQNFWKKLFFFKILTSHDQPMAWPWRQIRPKMTILSWFFSNLFKSDSKPPF